MYPIIFSFDLFVFLFIRFLLFILIAFECSLACFPPSVAAAVAVAVFFNSYPPSLTQSSPCPTPSRCPSFLFPNDRPSAAIICFVHYLFYYLPLHFFHRIILSILSLICSICPLFLYLSLDLNSLHFPT